ncbi:MAG: transcription termination/antitermination NusG family protein [Victivallales bacterium]|nr:transcription termination/antitermination NusG family protein [Victivallales bacterium]
MENRKIWTPLRTKPRQEKKLYRYSMAHNVPCYLPLIRKVHKYKNQQAEFTSPMFPGYVFCRVNEETYSRLLPSNAVVYKIDIDEYAEKRLLQELKTIRIFEVMSAQCTVEVQPELLAGTPVEITHGAFAGIRGFVQHRKNKMMLVVNIEILGQTAAVEINAACLEKV